MTRVSIARHWWPVGVQLVGLVAIVVGLGMLAAWLAIVAAGVCMVAKIGRAHV